ncbi:unnamed protein product [Leptosia nina]|uniref:Endonuclease/exonuclease/phosphatase domain-containing protein n=1 Tax=Leptosia nina TaxID=320188 RepID=A0AAV1K254_9NEOP
MKPKVKETGPIPSKRPGKNKDNEFRLCTWNVRTLNRPGALKILIEQLIPYQLDILALQEIRWKRMHTK